MSVKIIEQTELSDEEKSRIIEMWNAEYPSDIAHPGIPSFNEYLSKVTDRKHFLLIDESQKIVGWAMMFVRDDAKWFVIIVDGKFQGKGFGIKLLDALKAAENHFFGWVINNDNYKKANSENYRSPLGFYKKIGFVVHENEKLIKENISGVKIEWNA